jgi:flagellar hook-length control protein FliK
VIVGAPPVVATSAPTALAGPLAGPLGSALPERPIAAQLAGPIATMRTAGPGEHVLVVRVSPASIGPVRVLAHITADGVRIELLGGTDQARELLRAALPDLRRDLAAVGLQATNLTLGSAGYDQPGAGTGFGTGAGLDGRPGAGGRGNAGSPGRGGAAPNTPTRTGPSSGSPPDLPDMFRSRRLDITV